MYIIFNILSLNILLFSTSTGVKCLNVNLSIKIIRFINLLKTKNRGYEKYEKDFYLITVFVHIIEIEIFEVLSEVDN